MKDKRYLFSKSTGADQASCPSAPPLLRCRCPAPPLASTRTFRLRQPTAAGQRHEREFTLHSSKNGRIIKETSGHKGQSFYYDFPLSHQYFASTL